jgi:ADP-heptose:LPS heptosyltransferase
MQVLTNSAINLFNKKGFNMFTYLKNTLRKFDKIRRQKLGSLEGILYSLIKNDSETMPSLLPNDQVKRVLVIRSNKRIGNIIFLIPFIRQIRLAYPNARVDLMLSQAYQGQFFDGLGIDNIYYSHFSFLKLFTWFDVIKQLNQVHYDLVITRNSSTNDGVSASMIAAKNKVAPYNKKRTLAFPHALKEVRTLKHSAYGGLNLLEILGHQLTMPINHHLQFSASEIEQGKALSERYIDSDKINLVFFRGARGKKCLSSSMWEKMLKRFESHVDKKINWIEILCSDIKEPLRKDSETFQSKDMRILGTFLTHFDGFICCDTGPLHLADASGVKCIGLYTHTKIETYGLLSANCAHITDVNHFDVSEVGKKLGFSSTYSFINNPLASNAKLKIQAAV